MIWLGEHDWRPRSPGVIYPPALPLSAMRLYGVYPWPTAAFEDWVHEDDEAVARTLLPSDRVFRRVAQEGGFIVLGYGARRIRVRPALCRMIPGDGWDIGDSVEIRSHHGRNEPFVGVIAEMRCPHSELAKSNGAIRYTVRNGGRLLPTPFLAGDLQSVRLCSSG